MICCVRVCVRYPKQTNKTFYYYVIYVIWDTFEFCIMTLFTSGAIISDQFHLFKLPGGLL